MKIKMKKFEILVWFYKQSPRSAMLVEKLCDEKLDKSGALLGRIQGVAYPEIIKKVFSSYED